MMDMDYPPVGHLPLEDMEHIGDFYMLFGLLRQSIWQTDPRIKFIILFFVILKDIIRSATIVAHSFITIRDEVYSVSFYQLLEEVV